MGGSVTKWPQGCAQAQPSYRRPNAVGSTSVVRRRPGLARYVGRSEQVVVYNRDGPNLATGSSHPCRPETERAHPRIECRAGVRSAGRVLGHVARAYRTRHAACAPWAPQADPGQRASGLARQARRERARVEGGVGCQTPTKRPRTVVAAGGMAQEVELPCNQHRTQPHRLDVISDGHRSASTPRPQVQRQRPL